MITIKLVSTQSIGYEGPFYQIWEVNKKEYSTISEWGDIQFEDEDTTLNTEPRITAHDVITLAIHGTGPTEDGEQVIWDELRLTKILINGGYLDNV